MKKHKGSMISYLNPATQSAAVQRSVYRVENIDAEKITWHRWKSLQTGTAPIV